MTDKQPCHVAVSSFRDVLGSEEFPLEEGRYWLFTAKVCPFAHRTEIVRRLTGLDKTIGLTVAASVQDEAGWNFADCYENADTSPNPLKDMGLLSALYAEVAPGYNGMESVPVLFDLKTHRIVNNESSDIIVQFDALATQAGGGYNSLYPEAQRAQIDALIKRLNEDFVFPVYGAGFAEDQQSYRNNADKVFDTLSFLEGHLAQSGTYLFGEQLTLADVHAYPHLARFDAIYHSLYRLNLAYLRSYSNIAAYMARLAEIPAMAQTLDIESAKAGYFLSSNQPCDGSFVPAGPLVDARSGIALME